MAYLQSDINVMANFKPGEYMKKIFESVKDTCPGSSEKNLSSPNRSRTYDLLVTRPDALLLSYRRLMGAKAIKLGLCVPKMLSFLKFDFLNSE